MENSPVATQPKVKPDKRGLHIEFSDEDPDEKITAEMRKSLTPEQIYKLELARIENRVELPRGGPQQLLIPLGFFAMIVGIVWISLASRSRRNRLTHETVRLLAEKGQPVPPELFYDGPPKTKSDLRRGLTWSAIGLGMILYFLSDHDSDWGLGFIPLCIGIGYFIAWKMEPRTKSELRS